MIKKNEINLNNLITTISLMAVSFIAGMYWSNMKATNNDISGDAALPTQPAAEAVKKDTSGVAAELSSLVKSSGIDEQAYANCVNSGETKSMVMQDESSGKKAGVTGTPGNILFNEEADLGVLIPGAYPLEIVKDFADILLKADSAALDSQIAEILEQSPGSRVAKVTSAEVTPISDSDYVKGPADAKISLIEYSDYDCPFCVRFHTTAKQFVEEYNGQAKWTYRQFPLDQLHPNARAKSEAALCVGKVAGQDAFWAFSDALFGL